MEIQAFFCAFFALNSTFLAQFIRSIEPAGQNVQQLNQKRIEEFVQ